MTKDGYRVRYKPKSVRGKVLLAAPVPITNFFAYDLLLELMSKVFRVKNNVSVYILENLLNDIENQGIPFENLALPNHRHLANRLLRSATIRELEKQRIPGRFVETGDYSPEQFELFTIANELAFEKLLHEERLAGFEISE